MKIENPEIILADEARKGVKEEVRSGFLDWLFECNVTGDDGELYALGGSILSLALEKMDLVTLSGRGAMSVRQWHAYPNILPRELYSDEQKSGEKFETL